jgi:hypothetical protein
MNRQQFYTYLENPHSLNEESLRHLLEVVNEYPFFQAGRMLLVKNLHLIDHIRFNQELKIAAAHIPDRRQLFLLVQSAPPQPTIETPLLLAPKEDEIPPTVMEHMAEVMVDNPTADETIFDAVSKENPVTVVTDYFEVSDVVDGFNGNPIDFATLKAPVEDEPVVLPVADLLDYELQESPGYQLNVIDDEPVDLNSVHSFSQWLKIMRHHSAPQGEPDEKPVKRQMQLIDSFLEQGKTKIIPGKPALGDDDISERRQVETEPLMTETLANIYIGQKHYEKAIVIFERLSLKYPEKNVYFASRIDELEQLINNQ